MVEYNIYVSVFDTEQREPIRYIHFFDFNCHNSQSTREEQRARGHIFITSVSYTFTGVEKTREFARSFNSNIGKFNRNWDQDNELFNLEKFIAETEKIAKNINR